MKKLTKKDLKKQSENLQVKRDRVYYLSKELKCLHDELISSCIRDEPENKVKAYAYSAGLSLGQAKELIDLVYAEINVELGKLNP
jgi:hypothetical protein